MGIMRVEVPIRFSDVDLYGHVNNVTYLDYLQEARVAFIRRLYHDQEIEWRHVIVRHEIDYRRPLQLSAEPAVVEIWVSKVGGASYAFDYRIMDERDQVCATASTVLAYVDPAGETAMRIPDEMRAMLVASMQAASEELERD